MSSADLYRDHLQNLDAWLADALERVGRAGQRFEGVLLHAGRERRYHADDQPLPFRPTPHFARWVPLCGPEHCVLARPGRAPRVIRVAPRDFWTEQAPLAPSYWQGAVDLAQVESAQEVRRLIGGIERLAFIGASTDAAVELGFVADQIEPPSLMAPLDWQRATKTAHELVLIEQACARAARGHAAARQLFESGVTSERAIHRAYLEQTDMLERELPFASIVGLDDKCAVLHYEGKRGGTNRPGNVLLVDAGGSCDHYASDVTRTWTGPAADPLFADLALGLDRAQRELVAMVTPGTPYLEIHLEAHRLVGKLLSEARIVKASAEAAVDAGVTRTFFPHGVGHHLGVQVHDVGGHQAEPEGGLMPPPDEHPLLRNTRVLEGGHVVTIEPGIYFIPLLLERLRAEPAADLVDWAAVDRLLPCGGVRIEDDVLCAADGPRDLTRALIPGLSDC